ncbi:MAG: branched-chain amino acid ABC transporter permease [Rhodospirillales bacterium]|nr:branched-chain amino acid ABC transporter permease [Rhodospirillales bacterium]
MLLAACGADAQQRQACESLIAAFEPFPASVQIQKVEVERTNGRDVTIEYLARDRRGRVNAHWLVCGFRGSLFRGERLTVSKVVTDRRGVLNPTQLHMLRLWQRLTAQRLPPTAAIGPSPAGAPVHSPLYLLQQGINAIVPCAVYALLAAGFTLVYGLIGRINFAFGDMAAVAGILFFLGVTLAAGSGASEVALAWTAVAGVAVAAAAVWGFASERLVFRPLARHDGQAALIAAIGLAVSLREGLRLAQGSRDFWLSPVVSRTWVLARDGETAVTVSSLQLTLLAAAAVACGALALLLRYSRFGCRYRAVCEDAPMAALLGVDGTRIAAITFAVGGTAAGLAGVFVAVYYGSANAYMGLILGFKGLAAAVIGGFGSLPGAVAGGVIIGLIEQLWSAYLSFGSRDLAVFGLLVAILVLRPRGPSTGSGNGGVDPP